MTYRQNLIIQVHEHGDPDNALGTVETVKGRLTWTCNICGDHDDLALGVAHATDLLLDHLEAEHSA